MGLLRGAPRALASRAGELAATRRDSEASHGPLLTDKCSFFARQKPLAPPHTGSNVPPFPPPTFSYTSSLCNSAASSLSNTSSRSPFEEACALTRCVPAPHALRAQIANHLVAPRWLTTGAVGQSEAEQAAHARLPSSLPCHHDHLLQTTSTPPLVRLRSQTQPSDPPAGT